MMKSFILFTAVLLITTAAGVGFSQSKKGGLSLAHGKVTAVETSSITVTVKKTDVAFLVDSNTKYSGVKSLSEVKVGDMVLINYKLTADSNKIVVKLTDKKAKK